MVSSGFIRVFCFYLMKTRLLGMHYVVILNYQYKCCVKPLVLVSSIKEHTCTVTGPHEIFIFTALLFR